VLDVGILHPDQMSTGRLLEGQMGYLILGMKHVKEAFIGDTFYRFKDEIKPLPGFRKAKPMVFTVQLGTHAIISMSSLECFH
jgi:translation elongation factor EF-4